MGPFSSGFRTQHNMAVKMTPTIIDYPRGRRDRVRSPSWTAMPQHSQENFAANEGCTGSLAMTGSSPAYYQAYYDYEEVDEQNDRQVMDSFDDALAATSPLERFLVPEHPFEDMVCTSSHTFGSLMEDSVDAFRGAAEPQMRDFPEERCSSSAHPLSSLQPGSARACSAFLDDEHLMEEPY